MTYVKDLGLQYASKDSKVRRRYAIYVCPECGLEVRASVRDVEIGDATRCRTCSYKVISAKKVLKASRNFVDKARKVHGDLYDYSEVTYTRAHDLVTIICPKHGKFAQSPANHTSGKGCPKCNGGVTSNTVEFSTHVTSVTTGEYSVVSEYTGAHKKIKIYHTKCGTTNEVTPASFSSGTRCPICASYGFNIMKPAILYYFKIWDDRGNTAWKIGVTNATVEDRYRKEDCLHRIEVIKIWEFPIGSQALDYERSIKELYKEYLYEGPNLFKHTKNTELFNIDIYNKGSIDDV